MGASNTGLKSCRSDRVKDRNSQSNIPRMDVEDLENNNSRIFINPQEDYNSNLTPIHTLLDECDLNNNRTETLNNNMYTVSLHSRSATTLLTSYNEYDKSAQFQLLKQKIKIKQEKMAEVRPKKSFKKICDEKEAMNEKKKKQKSKPPRAPAAGSGVGGKRGMAEQDQMRRPRKKIKTKTEK